MTDGKHLRDGKWIDGLTADVPVGRSARWALAIRLGAVVDGLALTEDWAADPEPIHKLRVATRRAGAVLDTFADLLPERAFRRARKVLKRVRRAAGIARDADVFLTALRAWSAHQSPAARPGLHFLLGHTFAQRERAQADVERAIRIARAEPFESFSRKVRSGSRETLGERAVPVLSGLLRDLSTAAHGDLDDYEHLHRVRILGKRLRYSLELFIHCFPAEAGEQIYPFVEAMQEVLGVANDSHQAVVRLDALVNLTKATQPELWDIIHAGLEEFREYHRQRLQEQRAAFADWWRQWQSLRPEAALSQVTSTASSEAAWPEPVPEEGPAARP
jgi:CHAD domain-containing protein